MARRKKNLDQGDAISMEDALSMLVVIFVLFVVFLVPLVSMEKPTQLKKVPEDPFWAKVSRSLNDLDSQASPYAPSFGIYNYLAARITRLNTDKFIEFLGADSSVTILHHDLDSQQFTSIYVPTGGQSIIYKSGQLEFDSIEKEWLIAQSQTLYYPNEITEPIEYRYKTWFRSSK
jgi:hypothetical protein